MGHRLPPLSSESSRQFLWLFLTISASIGMACGLVYYNERQAIKRAIKIDQAQELEQKQQFILGDLETAIADLQVLGSDPELLVALGPNASAAAKNHVQTLLLSFLTNKFLYHQVRVLDKNGREAFRVHHHNGKPHLVTAEKLQDKSDRNYFTYPRSLAQGDIYLSLFNLNIENKLIERPLTPVIRLSTPILDRSGQFRGVLVINYLGDRLLSHLDDKNSQSSYLDLNTTPIHTHLVNGMGYWLNHHDPDREWGFALPERSHYSLPQSQPALWHAVQHRSQGHFLTEDQIYSFLRVPVLSLVQQFNRRGQVVVSHQAAQAYDWRLFMITSKGVLELQMRPLLRQLGLIFAIATVVLIPGLWSWLFTRDQNRKAQQGLIESEQQLAFHQQQADVLQQRLSSQIRDSLDSEAVIATAITEVFHLLQGDRCTFAWLNFSPHSWQVVHEAQRDNLPAFVSREIDLTPLVQTFMTCDRLCSSNTDGLLSLDLRAVLQKLHYGSVLARRIRTRAGATGVILCGLTEPHPWSTVDIELLDGVAEQVTIALNQAELYTLAQDREAEARAALAELKTTQTQLIRSEKMSSLGQLVAGVAHEINNPVGFIYGNVEHVTGYTQDLLQLVEEYQAYLDPLPPELEALQDEVELEFLQDDLPKVLASISMGAERIREIVKSLRTFSRLDESDQKSVDIHSGLESTLMILGSRLKGTGDRPAIQVVKDYDTLPDIECYPGLLNQVFMNLIANAIDAVHSALDNPNGSQESPTLTLRTRWNPGENIAIVQVQDNGTGIDRTTQSKLFDPFFTTKPIGKGTGLGLSISYQIIVENHQGSLECESQLGQGTTFTIRIPQPNRKQSEQPEQPEQPIAIAPESPSQPRIPQGLQS